MVRAPRIHERLKSGARINAIALAEQLGMSDRTINNLIDVQRRILACGSHAEALAPAELREPGAREAAAMAMLYHAGPDLASGPLETTSNAAVPKSSGTCSQGHPVSPAVR